MNPNTLRKIKRLEAGEPGNSMLPLYKSNEKHLVTPIKWEDCKVGDVVFCKVRGSCVTHKVYAVDNEKGCLIGNNKGHMNGWTKNVYDQSLKTSSILSNPTNGKLELLDNEETSVISKDGKIYSIWGTPYCKIFGNWAYMYEPETLIKAYESMPQYCYISRCTQIVWA